MNTPAASPPASPKWSPNFKLIIGFTLVAILAILLQQFNEIIGPLLLSFVLAFLLHPLATQLTKRLKFSWRLSVALVFLCLVIAVAGLFTLAGIAIVRQIQSLIDFVQRFIAELPQIAADLSGQVYTIGPFQLDMSRFDLPAITNQLLSSVQAVLGQVGGLVSTVATSTITTIGYLFFILLIAYFLLAEGGQVRENIVYINVPGYDQDIRRMGRELTRIWDAYLRSQVAIVLMVIFAYYLLMTALGMSFSFGLAVMAGLARLIPYIGPFIVWTTAAMVAYFQPSNYFNLEQWAYALLVVGLALLLDQVFDQYVQPRFMGQSLGVHPAAILVAAIVAYQWLGIIGLILAAPVLATVTLFFRYALRKLFDLDPWPEHEIGARMKLPQDRLMQRLRAWLRYLAHR